MCDLCRLVPTPESRNPLMDIGPLPGLIELPDARWVYNEAVDVLS